jgi:hypothetical protein
LHLVPFHAKVKRNGQIDSTLVFWNPTATAVWRLISGETPPLEPADGEPVNLTACQPEYPRTVSITSIEAQPSESIAGITSIPNCPAEAPSGIFQIRFFEDDWRIRHPQLPNHLVVTRSPFWLQPHCQPSAQHKRRQRTPSQLQSV